MLVAARIQGDSSAQRSNCVRVLAEEYLIVADRPIVVEEVAAAGGEFHHFMLQGDVVFRMSALSQALSELTVDASVQAHPCGIVPQ